MTLEQLSDLLRRSPVVASAQSSEDSPTEDPLTLARLAMASVQAGVELIRCQGVKNIRAIRDETKKPTIGLIKRRYEDTSVYITATKKEVGEVLSTGSEIVALDGTKRPRPHGESLPSLIEQIHHAGRLAMADCDTLDSARYAVASGADLVGTTLSGYTADSAPTAGPDLDVLRALTHLNVPVLAEGRYGEPWQVQAALRIGARGVVIGGALNDPLKQTRLFASAAKKFEDSVGAVDVGGTWLRFGQFSSDWGLDHVERIPLPRTSRERLDWIRTQVQEAGVSRLAVSTAGTVDPSTGLVTASKGGVPENVGSEFTKRTTGVPTLALNDGLASAWGHACLPEFAGRRVATLALGTGVGCGFVSDQALWLGPEGQHTRLNDTPAWDGKTIEQILGGAGLSKVPDQAQREVALRAAGLCVRALKAFYFPEYIVLCGGVGLSDWLNPAFKEFIQLAEESTPDRIRGWASPTIVESPFGQDAGLFGAAALALFPPLEFAESFR